jgi:uncharacterized delta-60 repeat protein
VRVGVLALLVLSWLVLLSLVPAAWAASGSLAWNRVYNGPSNGYDQFSAAAPAPNGGVYVAGQVFTTNNDILVARYDAAGRRRWLRIHDGPLHADDLATDGAVDSHGNFVAVGYASGSMMAVVKYGPGGRLLWARTYDDPASSFETASHVAIDHAGNIYVAGYRTTSGSDIVLVKYSPAGARRWARSYAGSGGYKDQPADVALDATGHVYVTGFSWGLGTSVDIVTLKYDAAGHRRWVRRWDGPASGVDHGSAMAVTAAGTVYVAGETSGISSGQDAVVLKYSSGGALKWSRMRTSPGASADTYRDVALLGNGDVAAVGSYYGGSANGNDVLLVRLSPGGKTRWARTYNGPDSLSDDGDHVARYASGAIYVTGTGNGAAANSDILTLKYNPAGGFRWAESFPSTGAGYDGDSALVARDGVYVAGYQASATGTDATLLKYVP